jgi:tRNA(fMet)-specific endonuclease VapC
LNLFLDTNILSKIVSGRERNFQINSAKSLANGDIHSTSVIVKFELEYGAIKGPHPSLTRRKQQIVLSKMSNIFELNAEDADIAAKIRVDLERRGLPIGEYDVLIAAQAIRTKSKIVTHNRKHFSLVEGLEVIDWSVA